jgi:hypothetical protein
MASFLSLINSSVLETLIFLNKISLVILVASSIKQSKTSEDLERQKLLALREQQQWKKIRDIGKAIG